MPPKKNNSSGWKKFHKKEKVLVFHRCRYYASTYALGYTYLLHIHLHMTTLFLYKTALFVLKKTNFWSKMIHFCLISWKSLQTSCRKLKSSCHKQSEKKNFWSSWSCVKEKFFISLSSSTRFSSERLSEKKVMKKVSWAISDGCAHACNGCACIITRLKEINFFELKK